MSTRSATPSSLEPEILSTLRSHRTVINSVALAPDHLNQLVSGSDDGSVIFWNLNGDDPSLTGTCYKLDGHKEAVTCVDYSSDGSFFLSASKDTTVKLWRLTNGGKPNEEPVTHKCHGSNIQSVHLNGTNEKFCTGSDDKTVKVWSSKYKNKFLQTLVGHTNWVRDARFSPRNQEIIASCGDDCQLLLHDLRSGPRSLPICRISGCKKSPSASRLVSPNSSPFPSPVSSVHFTCLDWYPTTDFMIAVGSSDSSVRVYDIRTSQIVQVYESHSQPVTSLSFHPTGKYLVSSSLDSLIKIYDLMEGRVLFTIQAHTGAVRCVKSSYSGDRFYSAGNDKVINIWKSNLLDEPFLFDSLSHPSHNGLDSLSHLPHNEPFLSDSLSHPPHNCLDVSTIRMSLEPELGNFDRHNHAMIEPDSRVDGVFARKSTSEARVSSSEARISSSDERVDSYPARGRKESQSIEIVSVSDGEVDGWDSRQTRDSGRSSEDIRARKRVDSTSSRSSLRSRSPARSRSPSLGEHRYFRGPEHNLLRGIVDQIGNLTDAVAMLERRLATVEERLESIP